MVASHQFQPPHTAGSCAEADHETGGFGVAPQAGPGRMGSPVRSGPATGKVVALIAGGELHAEQAGSRVNIVILTGKGLRNRLTASLSPADAERFFQAGAEIVPLARSYRQAKGA